LPAGGAEPPADRLGWREMHLRTPSIDRGVQSFLWALVFFLIMYFGMIAVDVTKATALIISLVASFLIFLFVRICGGEA
jgi:hypothetical protein